MTSSIARNVDRRRSRDGDPRVTAAEDIRQALLDQLAEATKIRFPSPRYRADPVAFFREILGVEPWEKQVEIIESVRDHQRTAVKSGHKVSKSHSAGGTALCHYCSYDDARVVMSSTTSRQVDQILWRELRMMIARGGRCIACKIADSEGRRIARPCPHSALIEGKLGELARTGLKSEDFREIFGFTAREAEAVAGISGANLLYIIDEASGVPEEIYEAIEGNRAGGARILLLSNPTKTKGEFYEAFHSKKRTPENPRGYNCITVSSAETPNVKQRRVVIPGLATYEWIEEKKQEWGEQSPLYKIRVEGEFAKNEDGKIFSVHTIAEAEKRWRIECVTCEGSGLVRSMRCVDCAGTGYPLPEGRLFIGLDPAGASGQGDESVFAPRRGMKSLELIPARGLTDDGHLAQIRRLVKMYRRPAELPVVVIDREGPIGSSLFGRMRAHVETYPGEFEVVGVRTSDRAMRDPKMYDRARDELTANLEQWIRDGGAIPEDAKLAAEMHELEWITQVNGRLKVTHKDVVKKALGRSPDRYDALALSVWEPLSVRSAPKSAGRDEDDDDLPPARIDAYAGVDAWYPRRRDD